VRGKAAWRLRSGLSNQARDRVSRTFPCAVLWSATVAPTSASRHGNVGEARHLSKDCCSFSDYAAQFESGPASRFIPSVPAVARFENINVSEAPYDAESRRGNADVPLLPDP
jgi:hypothetical protein